MSEPSQSPPTNAQTSTGGRRRSSGLMPAFEGLQNQKRSSEANIARRQSLSDQAPKPGLFGTFFHNNFGRNAK
ncbi:uncharacterized protein F5Z01DRAFT_671488 [Emericellopsis atlantica]|uniref:Conidiation-specific protein 8 n=1 Tax=Emericellopsis atlantica TaxID=2614577 RepID=A0A9P8CSB6_9HYPO|nr:uncharacterized protein F5Z01DRAFT_671488 [Emericellopsis atlantica]KAG9257040.1 hypothetical protein F5Z01DRAFT_671488 [Emericellopsis atlantica]